MHDEMASMYHNGVWDLVELQMDAGQLVANEFSKPKEMSEVR